MAIRACRVCGGDFFGEPLLRYENMPKAAQNFPDNTTLAGEAGSDLEVRQCMHCSLVQLSNEPVPYYREVIRSAAVSEVMRGFKNRQFADFLRKYSLYGRKILEVGCGRGEFLSLVSKLDTEAYGLEYSENAVAGCIENGLRVSQGYPDQSMGVLAGSPFDAFLLLMFLEHMPDPNFALRWICRNLADDGVGMVEVPNFDMVLRNRLFSEFIGDHLLYFTMETLETTLKINGFEVIEHEEVRDQYVLSVIVRKRSRLDISHFRDCEEQVKKELDAFLEKFPARGVAIWGAGHQALAIIAMTGIADRIRYVVDSAPFKQGRFTPSTHLPIVDPKVLWSDPVDAVIVMAASYSDEVARIVRQQFDPNMSLAVLRDFGLEVV